MVVKENPNRKKKDPIDTFSFLLMNDDIYPGLLSFGYMQTI